MSVSGTLAPVAGEGFFLDFHYVTATTSPASIYKAVVFEGTVNIQTLLRGFFSPKIQGNAGPVIPHLVLAIDCEGESFNNPTPVRNGELLWGEARGFILSPDGINQIYAEHWNNTPSPGIEFVGFNGYPTSFDTDGPNTLYWRLEGKNRGFCNKMSLWLRDGSASGALLHHSSIAWGWNTKSTVKCALGYIANGTGPSGAFTMDAYFKDI